MEGSASDLKLKVLSDDTEVFTGVNSDGGKGVMTFNFEKQVFFGQFGSGDGGSVMELLGSFDLLEENAYITRVLNLKPAYMKRDDQWLDASKMGSNEITIQMGSFKLMGVVFKNNLMGAKVNYSGVEDIKDKEEEKEKEPEKIVLPKWTVVLMDKDGNLYEKVIDPNVENVFTGDNI